MKRPSMILTAAAAVFTTAVALAAPPKFESADANGDGGIDAAEFKATGLDRVFKNVDRNGDGRLSNSEYAAALDEDCE